MGYLSEDEIVAALDELTDADPEMAHSEADDLLASSAPLRVREAWERAARRCGFWHA